MFTCLDHLYMTQALRLAEQGLRTTQPNPRVGCVIVKHQQVIGQGAHLKAGEAHAEIYALQQAGEAARGADVYVTLEPCSHTGRTPPCMDALKKAGVKRVFVAMQDPNPLVAGRGIAALQAHNIQVEVGLMQAEAHALNVGFIKRMTQHLPYVRCKIAASIDGRTALSNGKSQWITSAAARQDVQQWRAQSCAIVTGIGTVLADNPSMTVRLPDTLRQPLRVIIDSQLKTPLDAKILQNAADSHSQVWIAYANADAERVMSFEGLGLTLQHFPNNDIINHTVLTKGLVNKSVDLTALLKALANNGVNEVLLEAGAQLNGAFLAAGLIDEFIFYVAPKLMGHMANGMFALPAFTQMKQAIDLQWLDMRHIGPDIRLRAKPLYTT